MLGDDAYELSIKYGTRGNLTKTSEIYFELRKENTLVDNNVMSSVGGGVVQLLSFALRIAFMGLTNKSKIIILDEPLNALSAKYIQNCVESIRNIAELYNCQIVYVTHNEMLGASADKNIRL